MSGDPYFAYTSLLLPMTADFTDVSASPKTVTAYGNAAISNAQAKWGAASGSFDGSGDYLEAAISLNTNSFSIECWAYWDSTPDLNSGVFAINTSSSALEVYRRPASNHALVFYLNNTNVIFSGTPLLNNVWYHIALIQNTGSFYLYLNGTLVGSYPSNITISDATLYIGTWDGSSEFLRGYMQDFRVSNIARYTGDFTPPAAAFPTYLDLSCTASIIESPLTCAPAAIAGPPVAFRLPDAITWDAADGGNATVSGIVTLNGVPGARRGRLHTLNNGRLIRETWSDPVTGAYQFTALKDQPYYVWSEDYMRVYDPVSHLVTNQVT